MANLFVGHKKQQRVNPLRINLLVFSTYKNLNQNNSD